MDIDYSTIKRERLSRYKEYLPEKHVSEFQYTEFRYLYDEIFEVSREYAISNNLTEDNYDSLLIDSEEVVDGFMFSLHEDWYGIELISSESIKQKYNMWWHHKGMVKSIINDKKRYYFNKEYIETTVDKYLNLPVRFKRLDRMLVDSLIALELSSFVEEMFNEYEIQGLPVRSPIKRKHPLRQYITTQLFEAVVWISLAGISIYIGTFDSINDSWTLVIAFIFLAIWIFQFIRSLFYLPSFWRESMDAKKKAIELTNELGRVYEELDSVGPISAKHILGLCEETSKIGAVWPASVYTLLDDIISRDGRF